MLLFRIKIGLLTLVAGSLLFLLPKDCYAQYDSTSGNFSISIEGHYGFIFAHRPSIIPLQQSHLGGMMVAISKIADGSKSWQHQYHLPTIGIKYGFFGMGNSDQLGYGHTLYPYMDLPLGSRKKKYIHLQFGWGLGYVTKPFHRYSNYKNVAIGSHFNAVVALGFNSEVKLSLRDRLKIGVGVTHFSNGSFVTPNLGVNLATLQLHYIHSFGNIKTIVPLQSPIFVSAYRKSVFVAGGVRQIYPTGGKNYFIASLSANLLRQYSHRAAAGVGLDYFYDDSNNEKLRLLDETPKPVWSASRIGIAGGYEVIITDFSFLFQTGIYLKTPIKSEGLFYNRIGMRYQLGKNVFATVNLKTHWGRADFAEWGIGYKF
jgi:Lipid A 3-O-deacylase (PagL)